MATLNDAALKVDSAAVRVVEMLQVLSRVENFTKQVGQRVLGAAASDLRDCVDGFFGQRTRLT